MATEMEPEGKTIMLSERRTDESSEKILTELPETVRSWVEGRFDAEKLAHPTQDIFVGAWDYPANRAVGLLVSSKFNWALVGETYWLAFPLRDAENFIASICVELWKERKPRIVFSNWDGVTMRGERVFEPPAKEALTRDRVQGLRLSAREQAEQHFYIEKQVLLGIMKKRDLSNGERLLSMAPDWEQAVMTLGGRVPR